MVRQNIKQPFKNDDLPNLRARFLAETLSQDNYDFDANRIHILDGEVTGQVSEEDRHVTIYLYIAYQ